MATCTQEIITPDSASTPNTSGAFTPVAGDLLAVFVVGGNSLTPAGGTLTSSAGLTFHFAGFVDYPPAANHVLEVYISNEAATAVSQTVTYTPADQATSSVIGVLAVAGMTNRGSAAVRQIKVNTQNVGTDPTPEITFDAACLTGNVVITAVANLSTPAAVTEPSGFTLAGDSGTTTPTVGLTYAFVDSGFTGTNVSWAGSSATNWACFGIELEPAAAAAEPLMGQIMM